MVTDLQATNFKMFLHTVNTLSGSQGFLFTFTKRNKRVDRRGKRASKRENKLFTKV